MPGTLLLTAFEPVEGRSANTSLRVLGRLRAAPPEGVCIEVLPSDPVALHREVPRLLAEVRPERWLLLAEDANGSHMRVERVAKNHLAVEEADLDETRRALPGRVPDAYFSTLDPAWLMRFLRDQGLPAELSDGPGFRSGNLAFFLALHHARHAAGDTEVGFLHVPQRFRRTGRTLEEIRGVLEALAQAIQGHHAPRAGRLGLQS